MGLQNRRASWVRVHLAAGSHETTSVGCVEPLSGYIWKAWRLQGNLICCHLDVWWSMFLPPGLCDPAPQWSSSVLHPFIHPSIHWKPLLTQLWMKIHLDLSYHATNPPTLLPQVDKWHSYLVKECKWFLTPPFFSPVNWCKIKSQHLFLFFKIADSCKFHQIWSHQQNKKSLSDVETLFSGFPITKFGNQSSILFGMIATSALYFTIVKKKGPVFCVIS